jgi:hypothetical protein
MMTASMMMPVVNVASANHFSSDSNFISQNLEYALTANSI